MDILYFKKSLGISGESIDVPKIRTMYSGSDTKFAEFAGNGFDSCGKIKDDGRVIPSLRWLRTTHLDELPQVFSWMRGDLSLVGVRPRTEVDWEYFPENHRKSALSYKPGLFPAVRAYESRDFQDFVRNERKYLLLRRISKHPLRVQALHLFKGIFRMVLNGEGWR